MKAVPHMKPQRLNFRDLREGTITTAKHIHPLVIVWNALTSLLVHKSNHGVFKQPKGFTTKFSITMQMPMTLDTDWFAGRAGFLPTFVRAISEFVCMKTPSRVLGPGICGFLLLFAANCAHRYRISAFPG